MPPTYKYEIMWNMGRHLKIDWFCKAFAIHLRKICQRIFPNKFVMRVRIHENDAANVLEKEHKSILKAPLRVTWAWLAAIAIATIAESQITPRY